MKVVVVNIQVIESPKDGFQNGGWYGGRQYYNGKFSRLGEIIVGNKSNLIKELSNKQKDQLIKLLQENRVFK